MTSKLRVLDLFSGIGGFSLGLERTGGFRTVAFCEIEPFPRKVLAKHWPDIPIFEDVRNLHAQDLPEPIDIVCGGYPCQPFSVAGKRKGAADDRHLWPEIARLLRELDAAGRKPAWCLFENVAGHVNMGLDQVLSDLESQGYTVWPLIIPACSVNAPHRRDRLWIIANSPCPMLNRGRNKGEARGHEFTNSGCDAANPNIEGLAKREEQPTWEKQPTVERSCIAITDAESKQTRGIFFPWFSPNLEHGGYWGRQTKEWTTEPPVCCGDDGIPDRVARLKSLGNAVVPQVVEVIGRAILKAEQNK